MRPSAFFVTARETAEVPGQRELERRSRLRDWAGPDDDRNLGDPGSRALPQHRGRRLNSCGFRSAIENVPSENPCTGRIHRRCPSSQHWPASYGANTSWNLIFAHVLFGKPATLSGNALVFRPLRIGPPGHHHDGARRRCPGTMCAPHRTVPPVCTSPTGLPFYGGFGLDNFECSALRQLIPLALLLNAEV